MPSNEEKYSFPEQTKEALTSLSKAIIDRMSEKNLDASGEASNSLEVDGNKLLGADYLYFLDQGRSPGKFPPVDSIREWVSQKLSVPTDEEKSIAFLIGRKIANEGTEIHKNRALGLQLDELIAEMLEDLTKTLPDEMAAVALKELYP